MNKVFGVALVVLALGLGVVPHFTDCLSQGNTVKLANGTSQPMKCHWTAQAEIVAAVPVAGVGVMVFGTRRKSNLLALGTMGLILGVVPIIIATNLIGTCALATHICNTTMKPAIFALGGVVSATSLGAMFVGWHNRNILE